MSWLGPFECSTWISVGSFDYSTRLETLWIKVAADPTSYAEPAHCQLWTQRLWILLKNNLCTHIARASKLTLKSECRNDESIAALRAFDLIFDSTRLDLEIFRLKMLIQHFELFRLLWTFFIQFLLVMFYSVFHFFDS